ncbi:MAG TPA: rhomboid family intramembrane serine protease [Candidatus Acidoferrales bacterium]|nr:rhomboid family intramembrane serine protease [Candidatus Acidoferrales bacterium]
MLEDRDYMRQAGYHRPLDVFSLTSLLIVLNLIVFVWEEVALAYFPTGAINTFKYCALSNDGLAHGYIWQYLTFQFLHLGSRHFFFNMLGLFFLGRALEPMISRRQFITLYLGSGLVGGVFQTLLGLIFPNVFGVQVVGASAGIFGLLAALGTLEPDMEMLLFFLLPIRVKYLAWFGFIVAAFYILVPAEPGIAHAAHLGGMVGAFAFVRFFIQHRWHVPQLRFAARRSPPRELAAKRAGKKSFWNATPIPPAEDLTPDEFLQKEVDPILDKISERGIQSLTAREREILEKARSKMNRR